MPVTAHSVTHKAPTRAWTRGSPNRMAVALRPSASTVGCAIRSKNWIREDAALAGPLSFQQPAVDRTRGVLQLGEAGDAAADPQVGWRVDDGLDAQGPAVLEVLLDPGVAVEGVDGDIHAPGDDLGLERPPGGAPRAVDDPAAEDDLDGVGAADVKVVGDQRLEEGPRIAGLGEHDGAGHLDLGHRQLPPVPGPLVSGTQRQREAGQPALEEHADRAGL